MAGCVLSVCAQLLYLHAMPIHPAPSCSLAWADTALTAEVFMGMSKVQMLGSQASPPSPATSPAMCWMWCPATMWPLRCSPRAPRSCRCAAAPQRTLSCIFTAAECVLVFSTAA